MTLQADRLDLGQTEIDRMKRVIENDTRILLSTLKPDEVAKGVTYLHVNGNPRYGWELYRNEEDELSLTCDIANGEMGRLIPFSTDKKKRLSSGLWSVEAVYFSLDDVLIPEMQKKFPQLEHRLLPYFHAAERVERIEARKFAKATSVNKPQELDDSTLLGMLAKIERACSDIAWYVDRLCQVSDPKRLSEQVKTDGTAGLRYVLDLHEALEIGEHPEWLKQINEQLKGGKFKALMTKIVKPEPYKVSLAPRWFDWEDAFYFSQVPFAKDARILKGVCRQLRLDLAKEAK